jgi:uncharacterized surface protein with fasciclin (FAS1) repeats
MKRLLMFSLALSGLFLQGSSVHGQSVLKEKMAPSILNYLVTAAPEYSIMVKAINTARLETTFTSSGPITVFAPSNKAFDVLPAGTVDNWLKPEMTDSLKKILTYHVISGSWTTSELKRKIRESGGEFFVPTLGEGGRLSFMLENNMVVVKDAKGFKTVLGVPSQQPNGLVYGLDKLLLP